MVVAVVAGGAAVVALGVADELDEPGDAGREEFGDRSRHDLLAVERDPDLTEFDDCRLGARQPTGGGTGAKHHAPLDAPGGHPAGAGDSHESHPQDVGERIFRRAPEPLRPKGGPHQLSLSSDDDESVASAHGLRRRAGRRCRTVGDGKGVEALAVGGRGTHGQEGEEETDQGEAKRETVHDGLRAIWGKKRLLQRGLMIELIIRFPFALCDGLPGRDVDTFIKGLCGSTSGRTAHHKWFVFLVFCGRL